MVDSVDGTTEYTYDALGQLLTETHDGEVVNEMTYDNYGNILRKNNVQYSYDEIWKDRLICYNGKYGVMTENNGLLYMRARYYDPNMRRFISVDPLDGTIENAVTLNRYAYANANPITNMDPFGLSAERGSVFYGGERYDIYVPTFNNSSVFSMEAQWKTIDTIENATFAFCYALFFKGLSFEESNIYSNNSTKDKEQKVIASSIPIIAGLISAIDESIDHNYIKFEFQKYGDQRRVIIYSGSKKIKEMYDSLAGLTTRFYSLSIPYQLGLDRAYEEITGDSVNLFERANIRLTVDKLHKNQKYSSFLWLDSDGTVMQTPIIYANDRAELVKELNILGFPVRTEVGKQLPLDTPVAASQKIQNLFNITKAKIK